MFLESNFDAKTEIKQIKLDNIYYWFCGYLFFYRWFKKLELKRKMFGYIKLVIVGMVGFFLLGYWGNDFFGVKFVTQIRLFVRVRSLRMWVKKGSSFSELELFLVTIRRIFLVDTLLQRMIYFLVLFLPHKVKLQLYLNRLPYLNVLDQMRLLILLTLALPHPFHGPSLGREHANRKLQHLVMVT